MDSDTARRGPEVRVAAAAPGLRPPRRRTGPRRARRSQPRRTRRSARRRPRAGRQLRADGRQHPRQHHQPRADRLPVQHDPALRQRAVGPVARRLGGRVPVRRRAVGRRQGGRGVGREHRPARARTAAGGRPARHHLRGLEPHGHAPLPGRPTPRQSPARRHGRRRRRRQDGRGPPQRLRRRQRRQDRRGLRADRQPDDGLHHARRPAAGAGDLPVAPPHRRDRGAARVGVVGRGPAQHHHPGLRGHQQQPARPAGDVPGLLLRRRHPEPRQLQHPAGRPDRVLRRCDARRARRVLPACRWVG